MNIFKKVGAAVLLGAGTIALAGCATGLPTKVTRYSALPIPQGQTFYVVPTLTNGGGLEFGRYASNVGYQLQSRGYRQAASPQTADMLVRLDYEIDRERELRVDPYAGAPYVNPFYRGYYGRPFFRGTGYYGPRTPFYYGWHDPFFYGSSTLGYTSGLSSYTVYESELEMDIVRRADNAPLFEGRVQARSGTANPGVLIPNLIEAMFTGFPGQNGETVRITIPTRRQ